MTHQDLTCAVAEATGESIRTISRRGFSLADPIDVCFDPEPNDLGPHYVDWDRLDAQRHGRQQ